MYPDVLNISQYPQTWYDDLINCHVQQLQTCQAKQAYTPGMYLALSYLSHIHFSTSKTLPTQTAVFFVCDSILNHLTPQNMCSQVPFCFVSAVWCYCNHKLTTKYKLQNFLDVLLCMGHLVGGSLFCYASNLSKTGKINALHKDVWHAKTKYLKCFQSPLILLLSPLLWQVV